MATYTDYSKNYFIKLFFIFCIILLCWKINKSRNIPNDSKMEKFLSGSFATEQDNPQLVQYVERLIEDPIKESLIAIM